MTSTLRKIGRLLLVAAISLLVSEAKAQLKVGDNPTNIKRSAILELESTQQGLLLPRLTDTTTINTLTPPDGMIIYLKTGAPATEGLYVRRNNGWEMMANTATALNNWSLDGNTLTAGQYFGSNNAQDVIFKTNNAEVFRATAAGNLQVSSTAVPAGTTETSVLLLKADGTILQRTISANAFKTAVGNLAVNADNTKNAVNVTANADGSNTVDLPIMVGTAGQQYGFLTYADWQKLQTLSGDNISIDDFTATVAATDANKGAQITFDAATNKYVIKMVAASATQVGIVTTGAQTFGGDKTFANNVNVTGNAVVSGNQTVGGTLGVTGAATLNNTLDVTGATTLNNTLAVTGTSTLNGATTVNNTLHATGATTLDNGVTVTNGGANITGATTVNGNTSFTGNHLQTGDLHVTGNTTLDKNVTLPGIVATSETSNIDVLIKNGTTNQVEYKTLNSAAFDGAIRALVDKASGTAVKDSAITFGIDSVGTNFNLAFDATAGAEKITFNIPSASTANRGLVTSGIQAFGGEKSFANTVAVGTTAVATSTLDVKGSMATQIVSTAADYTATDADNTILAKPATGATVTITLPNATAAIDGRMYTVKKISGGPNATVTIMSNKIEDGATSYSIYNDWSFVTVQALAGTWYIIKH